MNERLIKIIIPNTGYKKAMGLLDKNSMNFLWSEKENDENSVINILT